MGIVRGERLNDANIVGEKQGSSTYATSKIVFIESGGATITVDGSSDPTELRVTIAAPALSSSTPNYNDGTGTAGTGTTVSRSDHRHPGVQVTPRVQSSSSTVGVNMNGKTPAAAFCVATLTSGGTTVSVGMAYGVSGAQYSVRTTETIGETGWPALVHVNTSNYWTVTQWDTSAVNTTRTGAATVGYLLLVLS
jgi:hypothetical protein